MDREIPIRLLNPARIQGTFSTQLILIKHFLVSDGRKTNPGLFRG